MRWNSELRVLIGMMLAWVANPAAWANEAPAMKVAEGSCYSAINYGDPYDVTPKRALYVMVDQTTPLDDMMRKKIATLVLNWGEPGDRLKVAVFSANYRGHFPEVLYSGVVEPAASEKYLYGLRWTDKQALVECLAAQQQTVREKFRAKVVDALTPIHLKTKRSDLLYSLKELSRQIISEDDAKERHVLFVSDGIENSPIMATYRKGKPAKADAQQFMNKIRRLGLVASWKGANIYIFGLGLSADKKAYIAPESVDHLAKVWERYFVEGNGVVRAIGRPELLLTAIQ